MTKAREGGKDNMRKYEITVGGRSARFVWRDGEDFQSALSRGAARLGYRGWAWPQENFDLNHQVTVTHKPARGENAREAFNGLCCEV